METNPRCVCELIVGLPAVRVLGVEDEPDEALRVPVETRGSRPACLVCGGGVWFKDTDVVELVDLPAFGRPTRLMWHKRRWCCPSEACRARSFTEQAPAIAPPRGVLTDRAARWTTVQVGRSGRAVADVAAELCCDWHTVNDAVIAYGDALLAADTDRIGDVEGLGLDETLFCRRGRWRTQQWCTSIVDVCGGQLLDLVEGRTAAAPAAWLAERPDNWRAQIRWAVLDLSGPYRATFDTMLPDATQIADPFHVVKLANQRLDEVRRRVQNETLGHRGRKDDPLYRARRLLTKAHERLDERGATKLQGLPAAGDPQGEVRMAWHAKETIRSIYDFDDPDLADEFVTALADDLQHSDTCPPEVNVLGRTLVRWHAQIVAWHQARVSNGPTEAANNLIKRIKRIAFGFRRFRNYRIRALLYAGRPNWDLLATITPR